MNWIRDPKTMTMFMDKTAVGIRVYPMYAATYQENVELIVDYAIQNNIDMIKLLNDLATYPSVSAVVARLYGNIDRTYPKLNPEVIPGRLLTILDHQFAGRPGPEMLVIRMLYMMLLSAQRWLIPSYNFITAYEQQTLIPAIDDVLIDMRKVLIIKQALEITIKTVDHKNAHSMISNFTDFFQELAACFANGQDVGRHMIVILNAVRSYIADQLDRANIISSALFNNAARNFHYLVWSRNVVAQAIDAAQLDLSLKALGDYTSSTYSRYKLITLSEYASYFEVMRIIKTSFKRFGALVIRRALSGLKYYNFVFRSSIQDFGFMNAIPQQDPTTKLDQVTTLFNTDLIDGGTDVALHNFVQNTHQTAPALSLLVNIDSFTLDILALVRSTQARFVHAQNASPGYQIHYHFQGDNNLVINNQLTGINRIGTTDLFSTLLNLLVIQYAEPYNASGTFPVRTQTIEKFAEGNLIDMNLLAPNQLTTQHVMTGQFWIGNAAQGRTLTLAIDDLMFTGLDLKYFHLSRNFIYPLFMSERLAALGTVNSLITNDLFSQNYLAMHMWDSIKTLTNDEVSSAMILQMLNNANVVIDPEFALDAQRNYITAKLMLARLLISLRSGLTPQQLAPMFNIFQNTQSFRTLELISWQETKNLVT